jgi:hypothetical protein
MNGLCAFSLIVLPANPHGVDLASKGIQSLFEALEKNARVSQSLVELDVSGNQFGKDGSSAIVLWYVCL